MRKALVGLMILALVLGGGGLVFAAESGTVTTKRGLYSTPDPYLTELLNSNDCFKHVHKLKLKNIYGAGADIKLIDFTKLTKQELLDSFEIQYRYDYSNKIHTGFAVVKINLSSLWQKD